MSAQRRQPCTTCPAAKVAPSPTTKRPSRGDLPILFFNATIVTLGDDCQVLENHAIFVRDGMIVDMGPSAELIAKYKTGCKKHDVDGKILMPGFICAHGHFYGMYSRGMNLHDDPAKNFIEVLERLWWRLDRALDETSTRHSAKVVMCAAIRAGTTTIFDHHASPKFVSGSLDTIADCFHEAGIRGSLCYEVTDRNGPEEAQAGIDENIRFIRRLHESPDPYLHGLFGLHASFTLDDDVMKKCQDAVTALGYPVGYHVHVGEGGADSEISVKKFGMRPVERLHKYGMTGEHSIFAHCIDVTPEEAALIASTQTTVAHNPSSNMNNGVGACDVDTLMEKGAFLVLGTDGITVDMIQEHKFAYVLHKHRTGDPQRFSWDAAQLVLNHNAKLASKAFGQKMGVIETGAVADFIILDYRCPTPMSAGSLPWHMMFGMNSNQVETVVCNGKYVMKNLDILTMDEETVMKESYDYAPTVWDQIPGLVASDKEMMKVEME